MQNINELLSNRKFQINTGRKINTGYEVAKEFLEYIGIDPSHSNVIFMLKMVKMYGSNHVFSLRSWFKDMKYDTTRWKGLIVWRLQNDIKTAHKNTP